LRLIGCAVTEKCLFKHSMHQQIRISTNWTGEMAIRLQSQAIMIAQLGAINGSLHRAKQQHIHQLLLRRSLHAG